MPEKCEALEELRWTPGVPDCDLMMYLRAARSMAAFAGMCDGGSAEDGCLAASRDDTTINAMDLEKYKNLQQNSLGTIVFSSTLKVKACKVARDGGLWFAAAMNKLHESNYDTGKALQALVKNPIPPGIDKKWAEDEQKRFVKGLRQYGKNFFKIRKELLPHKETGDLVEFYYLWKKSPGAVTSRTHRRHRRQNVLRRIRTIPRPNRPTSNDYMDASSASDEGEDSEDSDSRDISGYTCQHCFTTTSKDWLPVGKDLAVMCTDCRLFYKKHGELRPLPETKEPLPFLFQPVKEEDLGINGKHVMRTRRSKEQSPKTVGAEVGNGPSKGGRKSPGAASNCSTSSNDRDKKKKMPQDNLLKGKKKIKEEKGLPETDVDEEKNTPQKKKGSLRSASPSESVSTESSASNEDNAQEGDAPSSPSPVPSPSSCLPQLPVGDVETDSRPEEMNSLPFEETEPPVTVKEEFVQPLPPETILCPAQVKQEVISNPVEEEQEENTEINISIPPIEHSPIEKIKEEVIPMPQTPSPVPCPSPVNYGPVLQASSPIAEDTAPPLVETLPYQPSPEPPPQEENLPQVPIQFPGPSPQNIKVEPIDIPASPPPLPIHEPVHHPHMYAPASSTAHFSNSISIGMSNSTVSSSISASASISLSYHGKMAYPGHTSIIATSQSSLSSFSYRPFSPQYPYSPGPLPSSFPHLPSHQNKHKYSPSPSPGASQTPPPISSPYTAATLALPQYSSSSTPPVKTPNLPPEGNPVLSHSTQASANMLMSPPISTQSVPSHPVTTTTSTKSSPTLHPSQPNLSVQPSSQQKTLPQPAHQSTSLFSQVTASPQTPVKQSTNSHSVQRSHSIPQLHSQPNQIIPTPSQHLPPTPFAANIPPQVPPSQSHMHSGSERAQETEKCTVMPETLQLDEEEESEPHFLIRGPSPEPRVEDVECHRSQSAIFLRHWNRGEFNSCARTDLTFKPVPDSKLARKREERARKAAEKEREETKARLGSTPDGKPGSSSQNDGHHLSPFERHGSRNGPDTPALRQLSEYARPHATSFAPGYSRPPVAVAAGNMSLGVLPHGIDPILHYQLSSGMYGAAARESYRLEMEMEREKRERDLHDKLKAELEMKSRLPGMAGSAGGYDHHWLELQRRYGGLQAGPSVGIPAGHAGIAHSPFGLYTQAERERLGIAANVPVTEATMDRLTAERVHSERLMLGTDPLLRLQMAGLAPELHTHAHTHAHAHTHLHLHPHDAVSAAAAAAAAMGVPHPSMEPSVHPSSSSHPLLPPTGYASGGPRPGLVPRTELLHAQPAMMRPPYDEQLAHQLSAQLAHHEQLQRQILLERERYAHMGAPIPHPSQLLSQHEEFLRQQQQREREIKLRTLEEAARGGRPPLN